MSALIADEATASGEAQAIRVISLMALAIAILVAAALPAIYLWMSWRAQQHEVGLSARLYATFVMETIDLSGNDWQASAQGVLDVNLLEHPLLEYRRIVDMAGNEVTGSGTPGLPPFLKSTQPLVTVRGLVGQLEIQRSMTPMLRTAAIIGLLSTALGATIFVTLRILPMRSLKRALKTLSRMQRRSQRQLENYVSVLFERAVDGIILMDTNGIILSCNPKAEELFGVHKARLERTSLSRWLMPTTYTELGFGVGQAETQGRRQVDDALQEFPCDITVSFVPSPNEKGNRYVVNLRDISERRLLEEKQKRLANFDSLTGLPNRTLFHESLEAAMARARRSGKLMALMFLDLDHFKKINDSLGHDAGDELLRYVANTLTQCLRTGDTVLRRENQEDGEAPFVVSRLGGDEFTVIVEGLDTPDQVRAIAARLRNAMHQPYFIDGEEILITTSLGITLYPQDDASLEELIKHADLAMYRAKDLGRNAFQFYSEELSAEASLRLQLENRLRHALEREEFELHYQPKADLNTGLVTGVEALLRWCPGDGEVIPPDRFINLLEETGLILPVGEWVMRTAAEQAMAWRKAGMMPLKMSVNLSARQLHQENLVDNVSAILAETGLPAASFELELTESMLMDGERHRDTLQRLSEMGISIAIDDFGTGYSSLSYLKRFCVNSLKIDRSFVRDAPFDPEDKAIASAVIALAHNLNLRVVAEGVESREHLEFLSEESCDEIQGYYLGRPMPASAFAAWLKGRLALAQTHKIA